MSSISGDFAGEPDLFARCDGSLEVMFLQVWAVICEECRKKKMEVRALILRQVGLFAAFVLLDACRNFR